MALFLVALYVAASTRFLVPGLCVGMCAPLPAGEAAAMQGIRACCAMAMPMGGVPASGSSDSAAAECALCTLLTAPGAPSARVAPADEPAHSAPVAFAYERAAHEAQGHTPGLPRDPPSRARIR